MASEKELLEKAKKPAQVATKYHKFYQGKIEVVPKAAIQSVDDFAVWYTPGVAEPCKAINKDAELVFEYTNRANSVAVVTDGTRVLGLGDIGAKAGLPVMEGKALLFKYLGGVDAVPLALGTKNEEDIINLCRWIEPTFGGINLEDIAKPKCFRILEKLRSSMEIPVWHDDQQGTAAVVTAGFVNALKVAGKKINQVTVAMNGAGAANIAISRILVAAGLNKKNILMVDSKGILNPSRADIKKEDPYKWDMCLTTNSAGKSGGIADAMRGADALIAMSQTGPGVIKKEWVSKMADKAIVFACANPTPEIWPWEASEAGAKIVATGRSDFPNQVNNSLGFPGIFRGTLDVRARTITDTMCIAAAMELAKVAEDKGLRENYLLPTMDDWEVYPREAVAVGMKAIEEGVARKKMSRQELYNKAFATIKRAREETQSLMKNGFVLPPPA
ncbi:MAG: NADP-dependent malic enzyme [Thaumarchaeota archaeon]|nr:NADP-dependent malic enzyme [Nitrososphaerota archaeon]